MPLSQGTRHHGEAGQVNNILANFLFSVQLKLQLDNSINIIWFICGKWFVLLLKSTHSFKRYCLDHRIWLSHANM
jgi:hypothetical protein